MSCVGFGARKTRITDTDLLNVALLWFDKTGSGEYGKALTDRAYAEWDARQNKQIQETTVNAVVAICGFLELPCTVREKTERTESLFTFAPKTTPGKSASLKPSFDPRNLKPS